MDAGIKFDKEKPDWSLIDFSLMEDVVTVLGFGAGKYSRDNWKRVPNAKDRYFAALMRHMTAYQRGESLDKESGVSHLAHASCCLLFLQWFEKNEGKDVQVVCERGAGYKPIV